MTERGEGLELDPAKLISPHGFDGRGPTPPTVVEALKRIARLHTKVLTGGQLIAEEVDDLFAACALNAEWLREVYEARDALTAAPQSPLHFPRAETMLDEEATIAADKDVEIEVMVCDHCFHLVYPDGLDDYCDPDVLWPCATARATAAPQSSEGRQLAKTERHLDDVVTENTNAFARIATLEAALREAKAAMETVGWDTTRQTATLDAALVQNAIGAAASALGDQPDE